jgi:serine O-acetyltransferase
MFENLKADLNMALGDGATEPTWGRKVKGLFRLSMWPVLSYRFSHWTLKIRIPVLRQGLRLLAALLERWSELFTGVHIAEDAEIGPGLVVHTLYGINIGATRIGANCTVQMGVLIAAGSRGIGDNVYFGAGAKVIGDTRIGNNVVVVANSLVLTDVADNTTIVGVPARIRLPGGRPRKFRKTAVSA